MPFARSFSHVHHTSSLYNYANDTNRTYVLFLVCLQAMTATSVGLWIYCGDRYSPEGALHYLRDSEDPSLVPGGDVHVTDEHLSADSRQRSSPPPSDYWISIDVSVTSSTATGAPQTGTLSSSLDGVNGERIVDGTEGCTLASTLNRTQGSEARPSTPNEIQGDTPRIVELDVD